MARYQEGTQVSLYSSPSWFLISASGLLTDQILWLFLATTSWGLNLGNTFWNMSKTLKLEKKHAFWFYLNLFQEKKIHLNIYFQRIWLKEYKKQNAEVPLSTLWLHWIFKEAERIGEQVDEQPHAELKGELWGKKWMGVTYAAKIGMQISGFSTGSGPRIDYQNYLRL